MQNTDLDSIWEALDVSAIGRKTKVQRLVYLNLLYRTYVGIKELPGKRYLVLEIPKSREKEFSKFKDTKGLEFAVESFGNEKPGFVSCEISSSAHDLNDIFTIVSYDILNELSHCDDEDMFIDTLHKTITRWRAFFTEKPTAILEGTDAMGLFGELQYIYDLLLFGVNNAAKMWNGPLKSAQDFQTGYIASEIKTTKANKIDQITISDLAQLNKGERTYLFLVVYRLEMDAVDGLTLPQLIDKVISVMPRDERDNFKIKLSARGYNDELADKYEEKYGVQEKICYSVDEGFPCLTPNNVPKEIKEAKYQLSLRNCNQYIVQFQEIIDIYLR